MSVIRHVDNTQVPPSSLDQSLNLTCIQSIMQKELGRAEPPPLSRITTEFKFCSRSNTAVCFANRLKLQFIDPFP